MCGIFGALYYERDPSKVEKVVADLIKNWEKGSCRGPDNYAMVHDVNLGYCLGFHRLSINGLNMVSNQPFEIDGIVLICNGEVYNYKELYSLVPDVIPQTDSDCEVIIHLYLKYGIGLLTHLDAEFAFILIDKRDPEETHVYAARDPFGVRPLYWANKKGSICFASTILQLPYHESIMHIQPGTVTYHKINSKGCYENDPGNKISYYYCPRTVKEITLWSNFPGRIEETIRGTFIKAVEKRVHNTERPIACLLSGGLDSSIVTAISANILKHEGKMLKTFSIGMEGGTDFEYAKKVAKWCCTDHTEIVVSRKDWWDAVPEVIRNIESWDVTTVRASVGNFLVAEYIAKNTDCKVILNGDGADELMGGYLYLKKAPGPLEFDDECRRLLEQIYCFDVLRSDRSISSNGLEARTPFLDRSWVDTYLSFPLDRRFTPKCEKELFRSAWENTEFLPREILWRQKEAFSDGISSEAENGATFFQEMAGDCGMTEKEYYMEIFNKIFKVSEDTYISRSKPNINVIPHYWMPRWCETDDPSARTLDIY